jgi:mannose-6-phosphate isomerase-like protein (cupin superfamily)
MKHRAVSLTRGFRVVLSNRRAQVAQMVIKPGNAEGDRANRHRGADQWLYVLAGSGTAFVNGKRVPLRRGTLLLIEHGDRHEIKNTGRALLKTLNFYAPPAYTHAGRERAAGRRN